jgi:hypothetical protein
MSYELGETTTWGWSLKVTINNRFSLSLILLPIFNGPVNTKLAVRQLTMLLDHIFFNGLKSDEGHAKN